jgi:hypothetical protein
MQHVALNTVEFSLNANLNFYIEADFPGTIFLSQHLKRTGQLFPSQCPLFMNYPLWIDLNAC